MVIVGGRSVAGRFAVAIDGSPSRGRYIIDKR